MRLNGRYLREAQSLLARRDYPQASEKLWGASAEVVKAVAAKRGMELGTHASLWKFVGRLSEEHPDWDLIDAFSYAGNLHQNFYEDWLTKEYVERGLEIVRGFVGKLKQLV